MANVSHASLTGSSLHEPKGVASAAANTVYAANGAGSGAWTDPNTLLTTTNFTTGDAKLTFKTTADSGWVLMNDGSIGDALSGASTRANADCEDLFTLFWNNISNTYATVPGGRGANAAADWAAHKTIALPKELGRALIIAGSGSGLTARSLGQTGGAETHVLQINELAAHTHTGTTASGGSHSHSVNGTTGINNVSHTHSYITRTDLELTAGGSDFTSWRGVTSASTGSQSSDHTHAFSATSSSDGSHTHTFTSASNGSDAAHNNMQPFSALNIMVKL